MALRDGALSDIRVPLAWTGGAAVVVAGIIALALLLTDQRQSLSPTAYGAGRSEFDEVLEPVAGVLSAPVRWTGAAIDYVGGYFFAVSDNRRLKLENAELRRWKDAAIALKNVNDRYEALLKLKTEPPIPSIGARVVSDSRGPFSNARLADSGTENGVQIGYPVVSEHGVVGRVVGVTRGASRILLLTDVDSRTPVLIERTNARAILTGDGGTNPKLDYIRGVEPIKDGDLLLTAGDGGVYPRGLPVGVAARDLKGGWRARLYSDRAPIDFVRILQVTDLSAQVPPASLNGGRAMPPLTAQEQADLQTALTPKPEPTLLTAPPAAAAAGGSSPAKPVPAPAAPAPIPRPPAKPPAATPPAPRPAARPAAPPTQAPAARPPARAAVAVPTASRPAPALSTAEALNAAELRQTSAQPKPKPKPQPKPAAAKPAVAKPVRRPAEATAAGGAGEGAPVRPAPRAADIPF